MPDFAWLQSLLGKIVPEIDQDARERRQRDKQKLEEEKRIIDEVRDDLIRRGVIGK